MKREGGEEKRDVGQVTGVNEKHRRAPHTYTFVYAHPTFLSVKAVLSSKLVCVRA